MATVAETYQEVELGDNILARVEGGRLILSVDLVADLGASASGKSTIVASTRGNARLPSTLAAGVVVGLNIYRPR